ncbi:unnamed protein product [Rhizoctonia solani]|uniref:F-box domain-containing protein n=1 Tax=Rhizoctonia solani TaxID=456999 RepID=A0A8H3GUH6_9AGAM|nr:unnamed protein product [Rhizoctonia solani]CAE6477663.1 unnamed protein product [Rhizoctonia solani]
MISITGRPVNSAIKQWEEVGALLVTTLTKYLDLSLSLEENALSEGAPPKDLATRIDSALFSLQTVVDPHICQARSALAMTRNRILSPIRNLPCEILLKIFINAIFASPNLTKPEPLEDNVVRIHATLHNIAGVCRAWRDVALTQGTLWSIIPIFDFPSHTRKGKRKQTDAVLLRSITRAKGHLHIVATEPSHSYTSILAMLARQFRTANISSKSRSSIRRTLDIFLVRPGSSEALSELHLYQKQDESYYYKLPKEKHYLFPRNSPEQGMFEKLAQNLSLLRIRGVQLHWDRFAFTNQLTELHLQGVMFGYDIGNLLMALSSASKLRVLKLVSINAFYDGPSVYAAPERSETHLPCLQVLVLQDLYFNALDYILSSIVSRSHRLTLYFTENCRYADTVGEDANLVEVSWGALYELLRKVDVKDLLLAEDNDDPWLPPSKLSQLIKSTTPGLETLRMHSWDFSTACCNALTSYCLSEPSSPPRIVNLHITGATVHDVREFTDMVLSHEGTIRQMVFGGVIRRVVDDKFDRATLEYGPVVSTLRSIVQNFQLVEYDFNPPEFEKVPWQLW